jgi:autotransporter translocation and assembly factor TamB
MRRLKKAVVLALVGLVAACALLGIIAAFPGGRAGLVGVALRIVVWQRGYRFAHGAIAFSRGELRIDGLRIDDRRGELFIAVRHVTIDIDLKGLIGRSDRAYGLRRIELDEPHVFLIRHEDGSWNYDALIPQPSAHAPAPAPRPSAPLHLQLAVSSGTITVLDPQAVALVGKTFAVDGIAMQAALEQGGTSRGSLQATLRTTLGDAPLHGELFSDEAVGFGRVTLQAPAVPISPIIDAFVPTSAFVAEAGVADVRILAYTIGYGAAQPEVWHVSGDGEVRIARLHIFPLVVPVRDIYCQLHYQDGLLSISDMGGTAAQVPLHAKGLVQIVSPVRLAFAAQQDGRLERERALFAFSRNQPVRGPFWVAVRIDGPITDIRVAGAYRMRDAWYQNAMLPSLNGSLYYSNSHLTVRALELDHVGARLWVNGDFDLQGSVPTTMLIATGAAPAASIPFAANIAPNGTLRLQGTVEGAIDALSASGYARLDGAAAQAQTFFSVDPRAAFYGPALIRSRGGDMLAAVRVAHAQGGPPDISGVMIARNTGVQLHGGRVDFADDLGVSASLPSLDTVVDGVAVVDGAHNLPGLAVDARAKSLRVGDLDLGDASLRAIGSDGRVHIARATLCRRGLTADASGDVLLSPRLTITQAALAGTSNVDLATLLRGTAPVALTGQARGRFWLARAAGTSMLAVRAGSANATMSGVALRTASIAVENRGADAALLGEIGLPGARIWAAGSLPSGGTAGVNVTAFAPHLALANIPAINAYLHQGSAIAFATLRGNLGAPRLTTAAVVETSYAGTPIAGDLDARFWAGTLHLDPSRVSVEGNRALVSGDISHLGGATAARALSLDLTVNHGDLSAVNRFTGTQAPLTGAFDTQLHVGGTAVSPTVSGSLVSPLGTVRGVTFNDLRGRMRATQQSLALSDASLQVGSSRFAVGGDLSRTAFAVRATSPHVDMTDFNDFFGGKDVFAGKGDFDLGMMQNGGAVAWGGRFVLDDAAFLDYRLGHIDADFTNRHNELHAVVSQNGEVGAARVLLNARLHSNSVRLSELQSAQYRIRAGLRDVNVAAMLPLLRQSDLGLTGRLDADGQMTGTLRNPIGSASFALHNGMVRRMPIKHLSGELRSDARGLALSHLELELPYLSATAQGRYTFDDRRIDAQAKLAADDLHSLAAAMRVPGALAGAAIATVALSGTTRHPQAIANVDAGRATVYGIAFDRATMNATYAPGQVSIGDTELVFAGNRGALSISGNLPLQLQPLALGPKDKPIGLTMRAEKIDLSVLDPLIGRYATLTGNLNVGASIFGTAGNPNGKGTAQIRFASVHAGEQQVPLTDISADVGFDQDTIALHSLAGKAGNGSFSATGSAHIVPAAGLRTNPGLQFSSRLSLRGAQVDVPGWLRGTIDGDLSLERSGETPYVEGSVAVSNAVIPFSAIYDLATGSAGAVAQRTPAQAPGVPELRPGHTIVFGGAAWGAADQQHVLTNIGQQPTPAPTSFALPNVNVKLAVTAGNNVRVRGGSAIDLTTAGGVVIAGSLQAPTLDGQFSAVRGQVGYFATNFRLVSGTVTFDHESGLLPTMDVVAVTNSSGAEITLHITGRVDNLNTELSSNPSMSKDEIVAALLHAPQIASLTSGSPSQAQATLAQTAQSFFNAQLTRSLLFPFESALAQQLNIESLSFIFNSQGRLALEFRTRVTPTVSAVYQTTLDAPVTQSYGVSYRLRDYLALDLIEDYPNLSIESTTTTNLNLRYQFH